MLKSIMECRNCGLHSCQIPLLDYPKKQEIMVVGLSAKQKRLNHEIPLDNNTRSGRLIADMEKIAKQYDMQIYRTNLVKCPPLDMNSKIRYPTDDEINACFNNILHEIKTLQPKVVIMFGTIVQKAFGKYLDFQTESVFECSFPFQEKNGIIYVSAYHPSYVLRSNNRKEQFLINFSDFLKKFNS